MLGEEGVPRPAGGARRVDPWLRPVPSMTEIAWSGEKIAHNGHTEAACEKGTEVIRS
jgi:hypothetical protein